MQVRFALKTADFGAKFKVGPPWVDGEAAGRGVHAGNVLDVVDVLGSQLVPVVPVVVVQVLTDQSVWLDRPVRIDLLRKT